MQRSFAKCSKAWRGKRWRHTSPRRTPSARPITTRSAFVPMASSGSSWMQRSRSSTLTTFGFASIFARPRCVTSRRRASAAVRVTGTGRLYHFSDRRSPPVQTAMRTALAVLLLSAIHAHAQTLPPATYPFRTYGTEAGLGNLSATSLAQDASGFLWVGTQDGVYRYDGTRFTRFGLGEGLPSTFIVALRAGRSGGVWASTAAGVVRGDGHRFQADEG